MDLGYELVPEDRDYDEIIRKEATAKAEFKEQNWALIEKENFKFEIEKQLD